MAAAILPGHCHLPSGKFLQCIVKRLWNHDSFCHGSLPDPVFTIGWQSGSRLFRNPCEKPFGMGWLHVPIFTTSAAPGIDGYHELPTAWHIKVAITCFVGFKAAGITDQGTVSNSIISAIAAPL